MINEGMFRELVESSEDIVLVTDADLRILYASPAVYRVFRMSPDQIKDRSVLQFFDRRKIEGWRARLDQSLTGNARQVITLSNAENQKLYFDVEVSAYYLDPAGMVIRLHDTTEHKAKEKDLIRSNEQMDQVMYKTTHDLKAPLLSAMGLIALAEQADGDEKREYFSLLKKSLRRLDGYIDEMNNFFRNEKLAVQREKVIMTALIKEELSILKSLYEQPQIRITIECEGQFEFYSDTMRVRTIVGNLLSNAIKYRDPEKAEPFIHICVSISEDFCDFSVVDNGIGIAGEYHEKIFDLFFRATDRSKGTGLGLFIVKDTIRKLKGKITVNSILGEGTTFTIRLPNKIGQPLGVE